MTKYHCYREIRPAIESNSSDATASSTDTGRKRSVDRVASGPRRRQPSSNPNPKPKRRNVLVACESCKKRKIKCSAGRPECSGCTAKGLECRYNADPSESRAASLKRRHDEMASRNDSLEQFFAAMRFMPEGEAHDVLKRIRSGASTDDIVREIETGCLLVELASRGEVAAREQDEPKAAEVRRPAPRAKAVDVSWAYPSWAHRPFMNVT